MSGSSEPVTLWMDATGDHIFDLVRGVSYNKGDARSEAQAGYVPILRANNIAEGQINPDDLVYVPSRYVSPEQFLRPGDVLIAASSGSRSVVGKAAQASIDHTQFAFGAFCAVARPKTPELGDWLALFTRTRHYREYVESVALGININNFRGSDFKAMPIPLAPSNEQRRIVSKFSSLSGKSKHARDHLDHVPRLAEKYKEAILRVVFRTDAFLKTPEVNFFDVLDFKGGSQPPKSELISEPRERYIRLLQIRDFSSDEKAVYIADNGKWPRCTEKDILIGRYGASVGKILRGKAGAYNVALVKMLFEPSRVDADFLYYWLHDDDFQQCLLGVSRSAQNGFNKVDLEGLRIRIPDMTTQQKMVVQIQTAFAWIDRLAKEAASAHKLIDHLDQAILSKAFRGELVPQDPNDEPASVLLERIKEERSGGGGSRRRRSRKAAS